MNESELKKCRYCGESFHIIKTIHETWNLVHKPKKRCIVERVQEFYSEQQAIDAVNVPDQSRADLIAGIKNLRDAAEMLCLSLTTKDMDEDDCQHVDEYKSVLSDINKMISEG